jgi:hypothetical protein
MFSLHTTTYCFQADMSGKSSKRKEPEGVTGDTQGNDKRIKSLKRRVGEGENGVAYSVELTRRFAKIYQGLGDPSGGFSVKSYPDGCLVMLGEKGEPKDQWDSAPVYKLTQYLLLIKASNEALLCKVLSGESTPEENQAYHVIFGDTIKGAKQSRHQCPRGSKATERCMSSAHIIYGTQAENEVDKHFAFFIKEDPEASLAAFGPGGVFAGVYKSVYKTTYPPEACDVLRVFLNTVPGFKNKT